LVVSWWANIRFEKSFTRDLCMLLKEAGCIAVSGGLEVASDRLLELIQKGITVAQVARVNKHFTEAGIMVHAYLMYGFPTQTAQETIDSLDMVRQLFKAGVLQSAFWHQFAMTAHSSVGLNPEKYKVIKDTDVIGTFANNDIVHHDPTGADHDAFGYGLKKSLFNYMHHIGLEEPLHKWFEFKIPKTTVDPQFIENALNDDELPSAKPNSKIVWLGKKPHVEFFTQSKKGMQREMATLNFTTKTRSYNIQILRSHAEWLLPMLENMSIDQPRTLTLKEVMESYETAGLEDFELFWDNKPMNGMAKIGLLKI
ncbi:MAG: radical SAM protein, partial [Ferruginibacter sp.]